jgi:penicillin-binding protein 1C
MLLRGKNIRKFKTGVLKFRKDNPYLSTFITALVFLVFLICIFYVWVFSTAYPESRLVKTASPSIKIIDSDGNLLREFSGNESRYYRWVGLKDIAPDLIKTFIYSEDRAFYQHIGVNHFAILRAIKDNLLSFRVVSGASTISMQLARLLYPRKRTLVSKYLEMVDAYRLERLLSKKEIIEHYLNRLTFGHGALGIEAGAWSYFKKSASQLSLAQAAMLTIIPRSPKRYNPRRYFNRVKTMQERLLHSMHKDGFIDSSIFKSSIHEPIIIAPKGSPFKAPHFTRHINKELFSWLPNVNKEKILSVKTTLNSLLQKQIEEIIGKQITRLKGRRVTNSAVVVVENSSGDILAWVGSNSFKDAIHHGQVDGVLAHRQPGSALKPFTYAFALEKGFSAATIIPDIETRYSLRNGHSFIPRNYSGNFHGPVRVRTALSSSLNVPAFYTAKYIGYKNLLKRFKAMGFTTLVKNADYYGLGITMGNGEVTLLSLVKAYGVLARGGRDFSPRYVTSYKTEDGQTKVPLLNSNIELITPKAAYIITNILADPMARISGFGFSTPFRFPFPVAVKTGTSNNFRDNIAVGYTREITVAVWVGNFDGKTMDKVSGAKGAGPILRESMMAAMKGRVAKPFLPPKHLIKMDICPLSGLKPSSQCPHKIEEIFIRGKEPKKICKWHQTVRIDKRNNLLAGKGCNSKQVKLKLFAYYPSSYSTWINEEGIITAPTQYSPFCPGPIVKTGFLKIISPANGSSYLIDPTRSLKNQLLAFKVATKSSTLLGVWSVNNKLFKKTRWPHTSHWPMKKGIHKIIFKLGKKTSKEVIINIR